MIEPDEVPESLARQHAVAVDGALFALVVERERRAFGDSREDRFEVRVAETDRGLRANARVDALGAEFPERRLALLGAEANRGDGDLQRLEFFIGEVRVGELVFLANDAIRHLAGLLAAQHRRVERDVEFAQRLLVALELGARRLVIVGVLSLQFVTNLIEGHAVRAHREQRQQVEHSLGGVDFLGHGVSECSQRLSRHRR